jgi:hypothetical protein
MTWCLVKHRDYFAFCAVTVKPFRVSRSQVRGRKQKGSRHLPFYIDPPDARQFYQHNARILGLDLFSFRLHGTYRLHLASFFLRPWKWKRRVPPKRLILSWITRSYKPGDRTVCSGRRENLEPSTTDPLCVNCSCHVGGWPWSVLASALFAHARGVTRHQSRTVTSDDNQ